MTTTGDVISQKGYNQTASVSTTPPALTETNLRMSETNTETEAWTSQKLLQWTTDFFKRKELDSPRLAAEVLLAAALGCQRIDLYARFNEVPAEPELGTFRGWVKRHGAGEPVAYLVGHKEFYSLRFEVNHHVLIPRPETEHIVMAALDCAKEFPESIRIADVGTGSGCIAVTLATQLTGAELMALDLSAEALKVATQNAELHNVDGRVEFTESDLLAAVPSERKFDLIVSNPPYIGRNEVGTVEENVAKYEPEMALYGGDEGTEIIDRLITESAEKLNSSGYLIFEFSPMIAEKCQSLIESNKDFVSCEIQKDFSQHQRLIVAKRA
jgi:release factor glutamine methyltransferase